MMRFVSVRLGAALPCPRTAQRDVEPALLLRIRAAGRDYRVLARAGLTGPGDPLGADGTAVAADEHFAADAGPRLQDRWWACADVLHDRHPRPFADTVRRLNDITAAHPGCRLAAAPLAEGGWAVADGTSRTVVPLAHRVPAGEPLLASCLHAWLVAGHALRDIEDIRLLHGT
ncbi:hypothetical protein AB5J52_42235 [Streptomyces sp. R39]|uniref:Uncharacterized protein n=1 Tax=Streptomyces sp. R39 TaxID=3238631 RepID=A0AB39R3Q9_9ACTN